MLHCILLIFVWICLDGTNIGSALVRIVVPIPFPPPLLYNRDALKKTLGLLPKFPEHLPPKTL